MTGDVLERAREDSQTIWCPHLRRGGAGRGGAGRGEEEDEEICVDNVCVYIDHGDVIL